MPPALSELSTSMLSAVHDAATTGLVVSVTLAALFALAATATTGERDRRQDIALAEANEVADDARFALSRLESASESALREAEDARWEAEAVRRQNAALERQIARARSREVPAPLADASDAADSEEAAPAPAQQARAVPALRADQAVTIAEGLRAQEESFSIEVTSAPNEEARLYAAQMVDALRRSGMPVEGPYGILTVAPNARDGLFVSVDGHGAALLEVLQNAGLFAQAAPNRPPEADFFVPDRADVRLFVAAEPGA